MNAEQRRLAEARDGGPAWRRWGPYLAERQWGTVREDYSADGDAWGYFPHEMARSRAYRWGEDGIAGVSDDRQRLCLAVALWNERDPFLKERLFGLTSSQGNHGEDVKELYWYLDSTPTHSYMKLLYKYPQAEFPYARLVEESRRRDRTVPEFELLDCGVFDDDRYFDVVVEYAKAGPEDLVARISAWNRSPAAAPLHVLPQLWFRNTWSWTPGAVKPRLAQAGDAAARAEHVELGPYALACAGRPELLFCENETNARRTFGAPASRGFFKDGIHERVVAGDRAATDPAGEGTKLAAHYAFLVPAGETAVVRLRLAAGNALPELSDLDAVLEARRREADEYWDDLQAAMDDPDVRTVQRQALAGLLWTKQYYHFDVARWLDGDPGQPPPPAARHAGRNRDWLHLRNADVISMPDKWEYPWYAAWDLGFHAVALALVDPEFAKQQLVLPTREWYMHPNGQLPAYEWNFGDVNPPVHAWAAWRVYKLDRARNVGRGDREFLERVLHKLLLNFTWWVNRKDPHGRNLFQGGFLGLDNIGVFDRSAPLPAGGHLEQADGTSWMAMYSLNLMRIALELAETNRVYEDLATKFFEHFLYIAGAMRNLGGAGIDLWDEEDEFFYDVLDWSGTGDRTRTLPLKVRSLVGLTPLFAVETLEPGLLERLPRFRERLETFLAERSDLEGLISRWREPGLGERRLLSLLRGHRMKRLLVRMLDESEFLSPFGVRSLSRRHLAAPYALRLDGREHVVSYCPGDSDSAMFGGNSNWRGPIWVPMNFLIVESLQKFHHYYGDDFRVECPTGSGTKLTLQEVAQEVARRVGRLFLRGPDGRRPVHGDRAKLQRDPHFRDCIAFHEYFHGDTGAGLGASHQTGWTALVAKLLHPRKRETAG